MLLILKMIEKMIDLKLQNFSQKISSEILQKYVIEVYSVQNIAFSWPSPLFHSLWWSQEILDFPFSTKNYLTESLPASIFL